MLLYPLCLLGFQGYGYLFSLQTHRYFPGMVRFNERNQVNVEEMKRALPKRRQESSQWSLRNGRAGGAAGIQVKV